MRALSLWQPWASLLVAGRKQVETRGWPIAHRGPLLIHAAKKWDGSLQAVCLEKPFREALAGFGVPSSPHDWTADDMAAKKRGWGMPFGAVVGRVDVFGCWSTEDVAVADTHGWDEYSGRLMVTRDEHAFGDYSPGRFAFLCTHPVRFETPIPFRGMQGLFEVPDELVPAECR